MRVSIVTPSYNQALFLEDTIRSVLGQSYPDIEYMVMDAGSTDGSAEILRKYGDKLAFWQSRTDRGMADAINQGWTRATGEILSYLNSDDTLERDAVDKVVEAFRRSPRAGVVYGDSKVIDASGNYLRDFASDTFSHRKIFTAWVNPVRQPSTFIRRELYQRFGGFDESFHFCLDLEYWLRISEQAEFLHLPVPLSYIRLHDQSKTATQEHVQARELIRIFQKMESSPVFLNSGVRKEEALKGLYFQVSEHYLQAGHRREALGTFLRYCRLAFGPLTAAYRFSRYMARVFLRNSRI